MDHFPEIKDIDATLLTGPVRQALVSSTAEITHWEHHPIRYINTETRNLGLHRFQGTALDNGESCPWSIVLKAVVAPINTADQSFWNYHRREILAYQSGFLADLPAGISAPRCLGVSEFPDDVCWLWLEDLQDSVNQPWSLKEFGLAAFRLGQFNGAYLSGQLIPTFPWLSQNWVEGWLSAYRKGIEDLLVLIQQEQFWEHPLVKPAFPQRITEDICKLWDHHDSLLTTLKQLPQTFCHMDAYQPNLFIRQNALGASEVVAIDWVFAGQGAIGEEAANLLAASLFWFEFDSTDAKSLDEEIFASYTKGLRQAGWNGDSEIVRLGYTAACTLRWGLVGMWWMLSLSEPGEQADFERQWGRSMPELVSQWSKIAYYVLGLAQEAYQLQQELF